MKRVLSCKTRHFAARWLDGMHGNSICGSTACRCPMTTQGTPSLARHLRLAVAEFERGDSMLFNPLMQTQFEQFIIVGLLVSHPHNCTEALRRSSRTPASRDMKRAIDYMQGNLQAPITIADIAGASRLAGRTLFQHFRAFAGTSPMQYVRNARF